MKRWCDTAHLSGNNPRHVANPLIVKSARKLTPHSRHQCRINLMIQKTIDFNYSPTDVDALVTDTIHQFLHIISP